MRSSAPLEIVEGEAVAGTSIRGRLVARAALTDAERSAMHGLLWAPRLKIRFPTKRSSGCVVWGMSST